MAVEDLDDQRIGIQHPSRSLSRVSSQSSTRTSSVALSEAGSLYSNSPQLATKITKGHFPIHIRRLAIASKYQVRYRMVFGDITESTGPGRFDFAWMAIKQAAQKANNSEITEAFLTCSRDTSMKKMLVTFVSLALVFIQIFTIPWLSRCYMHVLIF